MRSNLSPNIIIMLIMGIRRRYTCLKAIFMSFVNLFSLKEPSANNDVENALGITAMISVIPRVTTKKALSAGVRICNTNNGRKRRGIPPIRPIM
jgi:hypothetical protein